MAQPKVGNSLVANFLFIIFTTMVASRTPRHSMARSNLVDRVMATDSFKATEDFFTDFAYRHHRMSCTRRGSEDRTPRRTHIFLGVVCVAHLSPSHTHACGSRFHRSCVLSLCAPEKSSTHIMFHRPLLDVLDPFPSCCSTPPPSTSTALPMTGIRGSLRQSTRRFAVWPSG